MAKKIFITATGTDIGKTYVSALIIKQMQEFGYNCGYFKPVLSGVELRDSELAKSDCNYVIETAKTPQTPNESVSYYWEEAISPHLAALRNGDEIKKEKILSDLKYLENKFDYVLIEGAGGITCPLNLNNDNKYLLKDLIKDIDCSIIIIADGGLGTINSTLLTVEYAKSNNINIQGIILNKFDKNNFMHKDNLKQIELLTGINVISTVSKNQTSIELLETFFI